MSSAVELDGLVADVRHNPFVAEQLADCASFADVPVIGRAELRGMLEEVDLRRAHGVHLLRTGGTLSEALLIPLGIDENRRQRQAMADHLSAAGVFTPTTVAVNLFNYKHLYRSASIFDDLLERCDATSIGLGAITPDEFVIGFCRRLHPDTVVGTPSRVHQLACAVGVLDDDARVELPHLVFGGEVLTGDYLDEIRSSLGVTRIHGVYASVEIGSFAWCDFDRDGPLYRIVEEMVHVEVLDPDQHGTGDLVITNLIKRRFPILRYRNGDRGRIERRDGGTYVELAGRGSYTFRVGPQAMSETDFAPVVDGAAHYQIQLSHDPDRRTRVDVLVVPAGCGGDDLGTRQRALQALLGDGDALRAEVRLVGLRDLATSPTTGKTPLVVDTRQTVPM